MRKKMNNNFIPLDNDDDVILIKEDTFKLCKLKEIIKKEISNKMSKPVYQTNNQGQACSGYPISSVLTEIIPNANYDTFKLIQFNYFADCQILKTTGKGWQKGQINIQIKAFIDGKQKNEVDLAFYPEESTKMESPLDDIRQMISAE
jgi:KGK domain